MTERFYEMKDFTDDRLVRKRKKYVNERKC